MGSLTGGHKHIGGGVALKVRDRVFEPGHINVRYENVQADLSEVPNEPDLVSAPTHTDLVCVTIAKA